MPAPFTFLLLDVADRVATVTINRPDKLNALNAQVIDELDRMFGELATHADVGAIVLTGSGRAFVAGADIAEIAAAAATPAGLAAVSAHGTAVFTRIERFAKPVIAAVNGFALGGGCELALACHLRVASTHAKFGLPEVKLGLIPGYGGTQRLPRLIGVSRAKDLILTGRHVDAVEAISFGMVNSVVPADDTYSAACELAGRLARGPALALRAAKEAIDHGMDVDLATGLDIERVRFAALFATDDQSEGMAAFVAKRPPSFTGN